MQESFFVSNLQRKICHNYDIVPGFIISIGTKRRHKLNYVKRRKFYLPLLQQFQLLLDLYVRILFYI